MQKNWYILYTKAKCEKKVSSLLSKKKIKNFYPVHWRQINEGRRMKLIREPLFSSYIFVYIGKSEIKKVKQMSNVINLVYWKRDPAIVLNTEIEEIKAFVKNYQNIRLERSRVNVDSLAFVADRASYSVDGNIVMIKNRFIKVALPSLGYTMITELEEEGVMGRKVELGVAGWVASKKDLN